MKSAIVLDCLGSSGLNQEPNPFGVCERLLSRAQPPRVAASKAAARHPRMTWPSRGGKEQALDFTGFPISVGLVSGAHPT